MANPMRYLHRRLGAAINWRVRDAVAAQLPPAAEALEQAATTEKFAVDRLAAMGTTIADVSVTLTDQQRVLTELIEQLDRRVTAIERSDRPA